jgi:CheY-like chemotaxis protein
MMKARQAAHILVIVANRGVMGHYRRLLEAEGYDGVEITTWESINQEKMAWWHPDLVLLDLLVDAAQEHQAWQVIRQLKNTPSLASIPLLICIAAFVDPSFLASVREQQVAFLFKPLDMRVLIHQIHLLLTSA